MGAFSVTRDAETGWKKLGVQCETTGFWDPGRHPADRFLCLLDLLSTQL